MDELTQRVNRAAEGILENESLTADLDDAPAQALLDWGVACARMIAESTAGLGEVEAEKAMSPRLRATRRLMRLVSKWVAGRHQSGLLIEVLEQAAIIYGKDFLSDDPLLMIASLRRLCES